MKMVTAVVILLVIAVFGCDDNSGTSPQPKEVLSASERAELKLPIEGELTLAAEADRDFVSELSSDTISAVESFLKPTAGEVQISAARPVGEYLLLWIAYPKEMDGGIDLIWSSEKLECAGYFLGGYRG